MRSRMGKHSPSIRSVEGAPLSTWTMVYKQTATGWSAFVPALPGVVAACATHAEAEHLIGEPIALHLQGLTEDGLPSLDPGSVVVGQVEVRQPA
jgi:predicted RNase H-like HicB family nuclease